MRSPCTTAGTDGLLLRRSPSWARDPRPVEMSCRTIPFRPVARSSAGSTSGKKADMARRARRTRRGGVVTRGKIRNAGRSFPPATEPAEGRARHDSQGILVFPFRTTPRRSRRGRRARPRTRRARCSPGALPAVHPPSAPFVAHRQRRLQPELQVQDPHRILKARASVVPSPGKAGQAREREPADPIVTVSRRRRAGGGRARPRRRSCVGRRTARRSGRHSRASPHHGVKRVELVRHLEARGCRLLREGARRSVFVNRAVGKATSVPRHWRSRSRLRSGRM